ncbi:MAG: acyl-CoA/acyl-ACP dehydrogenase [Deltaproteobacteria bacterium]|nr:acyl-CoA/acyl-ACP dehydrogenase [Deltaproteobacteria bacterium]
MYDLILDKDQLRVADEAREFAKSIDPALLRRMDADEVRYPTEYVVEAARRNLLGLRFPKEYGGRGLPWVVEMAALEEIGVLGTSLGCLASLPSIVCEGIAAFGTPRQKEEFMGPILRGEKFCAEALTEPRGGSDFFGAATVARKEGDHFVLDGQKRFVVGAEGADVFFVYARTGDGPREITAFLVERDDSVHVEHVYNLLGTRGGGTGRLVFKGAVVPESNVVLGVGRGAEVFNAMMVPERMTSAAGALGMGRAATELAARYSTRRKAFGKPIRRFEAVSFMIADALSAVDAARGLTIMAAKAADKAGNVGAGIAEGTTVRRLVSEAKKAATEAGWLAVNNAMQVMGGIGYTQVYPLERYLRDARLSLIWTGTNQIMNLLIQHEYYREFQGSGPVGRDVEMDAMDAESGADEKVYE